MLGLVAFARDDDHVVVCGIVQRGFDRATAILVRNRALLEQTSTLLLERETLGASDLPMPEPERGGADA